MSTSVPFYRSIDDTPVCVSCAKADVRWPRTFDDVLAGDRCGLGRAAIAATLIASRTPAARVRKDALLGA